MIESVRRFLSVVLLCLTLTIVAACGGGTMGTGIVPTGFGMKTHGTEVSFVFVASVRDTGGRAVSGAIITVAGSGGTVSRQTDRAGRARLPLMMRSGEYLEFSVAVGKERYTSTQQLSPAGAREVEQGLVIEHSGDLIFK